MGLKDVSLRVKLVGGFCTVIFISCGGLALLSYRAAERAQQKSIEESLPSMAVEASKLIRARLDIHIVSIEGVANRDVIKSMDWERQGPALEAETKRLGYLGMGIIMPDGMARYPDGATAFLGDRDYFKHALAGQTFISDVIISRITGKPVMVLATPVRDYSGTVVAVLLARLDGNFLSGITDQIKYGKNGYSYVINDKGALIAHNNRDYVAQARNFLEEGKTKEEYRLLSQMMQKMIDGESGFDEYWFVGYNRLFGYAPIPGTGWSLAIGAIKKEVFAEIYAMRIKFLIIGLLVLVFGLASAIAISESIIRPIRKAIERFSDISEGEGDLTKTLAVDRRDEMGQMGRHFNSFVEKLKVIIAQVRMNLTNTVDNNVLLMDAMNKSRQSAEDINQSSEAIKELIVNQSAVVSEVSSTIEEIAKTIESQDNRISSQSANVTESSAAIQEMIASINAIGNNLANSSREFDNLQAVVTTGNNNVNTLRNLVTDLSKQSDSVLEANSIIKNIAAQTNLLAMNAAIEAAHAGDAGRGFAVVADEIRKLAEISNKQSKLISQNLEALRTSIASAVGISESTGDSFRTIVISVKNVTNIEKEIKNALSEQASGSTQILEALGGISQITEEIHQGSAEMLLGSNGIIKEISGLVQVTEKVRQNIAGVVQKAEEVNNLVKKSVELLEVNSGNIEIINVQVSAFKIDG